MRVRHVERAKDLDEREASERKKNWWKEGRRKRKKERKNKLARENLAPHTYIFQCVQKTCVPKCNIIKPKR